MENVRYNISPCEESEVNDFIGKIDTDLFVPNGTVHATERSHYDRYSFLRDETKVAVVYDTSANIVSITGRYDYAKELLELFGPDAKSVKRSFVPAQGETNQKPMRSLDDVSEITLGGADNSMRAKLFVSPDRLRRRTQFAPAPTVFASAKGAIISTDEIFPPQTCKKRSYNDVSQTPKQSSPTALGADNGGVPTDGNYFDPGSRVSQFGGNGGFGVNGGNGGFGGNGGNGGKTPIVKRPLTSYGEYDRVQSNGIKSRSVQNMRRMTEQSADSDRPVGISISVGGRAPSALPRKAVISFGSDDDGKTLDGEFKINTRSAVTSAQSTVSETGKRKRGRPPKQKAQNDIIQFEKQPVTVTVSGGDTPKKRGRPPKNKTIQTQDHDGANVSHIAESTEKLEYKNGYAVKNCPQTVIDGVIKRLRDTGITVTNDGVEFADTPQEVTSVTVSDVSGQKVVLRYATKRKTLQVQGKESKLFGDVVLQLNRGIENAVDAVRGGRKIDDIEGVKKDKLTNDDKRFAEDQAKLKKRLPTAYDYLSEQSRKDFSYGIHDFGIADLVLGDYSVLLVPAFRGLERFVFDLQRAEGINVKMIGQAYDKDDNGRYMLKSGYTKRIDSVVYAEVMVALYTEYFAQRNFFAHSDNTDNNVSRSISERAEAKRIFDHLLDVVEYNAKKLKEIGFKF